MIWKLRAQPRAGSDVRALIRQGEGATLESKRDRSARFGTECKARKVKAMSKSTGGRRVYARVARVFGSPKNRVQAARYAEI